jgi:GT2 family glycosyltransferase
MITFSVLVCTYNHPEMLEMALNALINRTDEKPNQVVVVNGGDERSDQLVLKYLNRSDIKVELVKIINKNLANSRNIGLSYCTGDIIAMTDDDAEVFPNWVTQMKKNHAEHPEAGGVGGAVLGADSGKSLLSRIADVATFSSPPKPGYVRTIAGVNVSYKKNVLQAVGQQDETLFRGEDVDFNWRIMNLGYEIYYTPEIKVIHHHRPDFKQFLHQFHMYGRAYYLVRRKWPEMYCVYPHQIRRLKDALKVINFFVSIFYDPMLVAARLESWFDRLRALPILFASQVYWKSGVIYQSWLVRSNNL